MAVKVEIAVACGYMQYHTWWGAIIARLLSEQKTGEVDIAGVYPYGTALPDHIKNKAVAGWVIEQKRRNNLTDANRSAIVGGNVNDGKMPDGFLTRGAEWLMWIDDDTIPPKGFLTHLLSLGRDFVGGVYYLGEPPYNPIAYLREENGLYRAVYNYPHGALIQVDSIGMGCTLIHRSVYERIQDGHEVFSRPDGSLVVVARDTISTHKKRPEPDKTCVINGVLHIPLSPVQPDDNRAWPFYAMEYGRTEDHYFCELADHVGIRPWLDTQVVCEHLKVRPVTRQDYLNEVYGGRVKV